MYRKTQKKREMHICFDDGGIGDNLARLPIIPYILEVHPHVHINLWVPTYFEDIAFRSIKKNPRLRIINFDKSLTAKSGIIVRKFALQQNPYSNLGSHMTDHAFHIICNTDHVEDKYKNYLPIHTKQVHIKNLGLPEKYVIMTTGFTANCREMIPEVVNGICQYLVKKGYTPVFLGKTEAKASNHPKMKIIGEFSDEIDYSIGLDLREKTSLVKAVKIMQGAAGIVGLDNGLLHLAATTDIPIVAGFTNVNPVCRAPYRHDIKGWNFYPVTLSQEELACNFCQSNMTFTFDHSFKECVYNDFKCLSMLNTERYITELEKILD